MSELCSHCGGAVVEDVCEDCGRPARRAVLVKASTGGFDGADALSVATTPTGRTANTSRITNSTRFTVNYPSRTVGNQATKPTRRRADVSTHTSTRRNALGGGLISLPDLPSLDPLKLLMTAPEVPLAKRRCPKCDKQVNRTKGFCPACGSAYDFVPHLQAGDVIAGKYEIKGTLAFGGLGWIYLGWDQVLTRWVVLKGLLNANDEASAAAAVAERRYLAAVKHAKIVGIYDFASHGTEGFIVMEYVGGVTVHSLRKQRGPLPVAEAIAYVLGILPAFAYLHAQGLVYCDFKPDNVMVEAGDVKLIDMGAVRKIGDPNGDIYATVGFAAPEADTDPVAVSDLYTLGRTLAMLIMDFRFSSDCVHSLPSADEQPVLAAHESLYRFLLRATHIDPDERFQSADEMADQLFGVLREIVALESGPKPADSKVFTADHLLKADVETLLKGPQPASLPGLRVNLQDRAANEVVRVLGLQAEQQLPELQALVERYGNSAVEPRLRLAELLIRNPDLAPETRDTQIDAVLALMEAADPFDWRPQWLRGLWLLTEGQGAPAKDRFERVYFEMPGELAPRLAMGFAAELAGQFEQALPYYDRVGRVDPAHVTAHLGAARCQARLGRLDEAVLALQRVPSNHVLRTPCQLAIGELLLAQPDRIDTALLRQAATAVQTALPEGGVAHQLAGRLYALALNLARQLTWPADDLFLGRQFQENSLRLGAEEQFRKAAREVSDAGQRQHWVGLANRVRPVTLF
ncbi:MAG: tetratricopeptide repeat protein [Leptothrix sp. (in: b-proteobacteria)]